LTPNGHPCPAEPACFPDEPRKNGMDPRYLVASGLALLLAFLIAALIGYRSYRSPARRYRRRLHREDRFYAALMARRHDK
jgi:hypothetical protein